MKGYVKIRNDKNEKSIEISGFGSKDSLSLIKVAAKSDLLKQEIKGKEKKIGFKEKEWKYWTKVL